MTVGVKICGVTRPEDAERAAELGARWIGLNFWPGSPRRIGLALAGEIVSAVAGRASLVGVFVDQDPGFVAETADAAGLDLVQLHGDEGPKVVERFGERAIKVFRIEDGVDFERFGEYPRCWGFLLDRRHPDLFGGTGEGWPFELARDRPTERPVLVAGGIGPETVADVIHACRPDGIDVCSGIESAPGVKDHHRLRALFEEIAHGKATTTP